MNENHKTTVITYIIGFLLSIILTVASYLFAIQHLASSHSVFSHQFLTAIFLLCALMQLVVQLLFFLHVGQESNPRWHLLFFLSTFSLVLLVVIASFWIMSHLNYNMTPRDINQRILIEEGMHR